MTVLRPRATVIVPCYNYGRFVAQSVDSVLGQSVEEIEIIAIDDASTDETARVLDRYEGHPRVRVIRHERNVGHLRSYNEGIAAARGQAIALLSADDYCIDPNAMEKQLAMLERHPEVGFVYGGHVLVEFDGRTTSILPWPHDRVRPGREEFADLIWGNHITHSGTIIRSDLQRELGPYDLRLPHTGDWDLWLRAAARRDVGYVAAPLYAYRMHRANMRHRQISPAHAADESMLALERGFAALPPTEQAGMSRLYPRALTHALLQNVWFDLFVGENRRAWQGLIHAVRRRLAVLAAGEAWRLLARLSLSALIGQRRYRRADALLRRLRGVTTAPRRAI